MVSCVTFLQWVVTLSSKSTLSHNILSFSPVQNISHPLQDMKWQGVIAWCLNVYAHAFRWNVQEKQPWRFSSRGLTGAAEA